MSTVISVENVSKMYRLGEVGTGTLSHDLNRWWHKVRGKDDPYLKIGESNDRASKGDSEYVYALRDINFEVKQGEVLGIIGKNGAGKSTLLKLLSRVTSPTSGKIKIKGRTASLLEVGTGFHPELTGRENIFLNGAILGMTKAEIRAKFDEIVDFSGVERYIDTPVKRYSSGMYVRLAFAVAAHLDPEILIVDEVLAVGDAEFQKKCLGKMGDISKNEGRTILFVSHNMGAVKSLCSRGIVLQNGHVSFAGQIHESIEIYQNIEKSQSCNRNFLPNERPKSEFAELVSYRLINGKGQLITSLDVSEDSILEIDINIKGLIGKNDVFLPNLHVFDSENNYYFISSVVESDAISTIGHHKISFKISGYYFNVGYYRIAIALTSYPNTFVHFFLNPAFTFEVTENDVSKRLVPYRGDIPGLARLAFEYKIHQT